jgi:signal transduction histidine kinase
MAMRGGFLDMARKLQDRSDTIRTFATHVSHELKSPLTSIQGAAELLRDGSEDMTPAQRQKFHANIVADTERLNRLVRRLIELARAEGVDPSAGVTTIGEAANAVPHSIGVPIHIDEGSTYLFECRRKMRRSCCPISPTIPRGTARQSSNWRHAPKVERR